MKKEICLTIICSSMLPFLLNPNQAGKTAWVETNLETKLQLQQIYNCLSLTHEHLFQASQKKIAFQEKIIPVFSKTKKQLENLFDKVPILSYPDADEFDCALPQNLLKPGTCNRHNILGIVYGNSPKAINNLQYYLVSYLKNHIIKAIDLLKSMSEKNMLLCKEDMRLCKNSIEYTIEKLKYFMLLSRSV